MKVALIVTTLGGCTQPSPLPTQTATPSLVQLTSIQPTAAVPVSLHGATVLELAITGIDNPPDQALSISVVLEVVDAGRRQDFEIGSVTPLPPDQPATFLMSIPKEAQTAMNANPGGASALLRLTPVADQGALRDGISMSLALTLRDDAPRP